MHQGRAKSQLGDEVLRHRHVGLNSNPWSPGTLRNDWEIIHRHGRLSVSFAECGVPSNAQGVNDAEVILSYDYEFNVEGEDISGNTTSTIFLIKVDNSWLINDDDDESAGENDEEKVRALLDEQIAAMNNVDVETVYSQRTPGYRSRVTVEEFQDFIMLAFAQFLPMVESGEAAVEITDLKIRVDGDWAYMTGTLGINGTSIQEYTDESPDIWHQIDGTWYNVETNPIFPGYDASELPE